MTRNALWRGNVLRVYMGVPTMMNAVQVRRLVESSMRDFMRKLADEMDLRAKHAHTPGSPASRALRTVATELRNTADTAPDLPPDRFVAVRENSMGFAAYVFEWSDHAQNYIAADSGLARGSLPTDPHVVAEAHAMAERLGCEVQP